MRFEDVLKGMVNSIDGGLAGAIIGRDGIAVENYMGQDRFYDTDSLAVLYNKIIEEIKIITEVLNTGDIDEVAISARDSMVFIRLINEKYFMVLIVKNGAIHGKARFVLKKTALMIADEF